MSKITERLKHNRIENGYCVICGEYGKLTKDHVPPKGSVIITRREQRTICEAMNGDETIIGIKTNLSSTFKTICTKCNSLYLGSGDGEIKNVTTTFTNAISNYFRNTNSIYTYIKVPFDSLRFTRSIIGHILAASSVEECSKPIVDSPYFTPLRKFVLHESETYQDTHEMYYWFYPKDTHISAKFLSFMNEGAVVICSVLHFFPISILITLKPQSIYPKHASKLRLSDMYLHFNMTSANIETASFPFMNLKGNQMMLLNNGYTCISYPIKN